MRFSRGSYPQRIQVALLFESLPAHMANALLEPTTKNAMTGVLLDAAVQDNYDHMLHVMRELASSIKTTREYDTSSVVEFDLTGVYGELDSYYKLRQRAMQVMHGQPKDRVEAAMLAFSLHTKTQRGLLTYMSNGLLSKLACSDILNLATLKMSSSKNEPHRVAIETGNKKTGKPMSINPQRPEALVKTVGTLDMDPMTKAFHDAKIEEFRGKFERGEIDTTPATAALPIIQQRIKALDL